MSSDFDGDWSVDLIDMAHFDACMTGPGEDVGVGCNVADADGDGDVDLADFAALQLIFAQ
jgi:Dockerin type I domain